MPLAPPNNSSSEVLPFATVVAPGIYTGLTVENLVPFSTESNPNAPTSVPLIVTSSILIVLSSLIVKVPPAASIWFFNVWSVVSFV